MIFKYSLRSKMVGLKLEYAQNYLGVGKEFF